MNAIAFDPALGGMKAPPAASAGGAAGFAELLPQDRRGVVPPQATTPQVHASPALRAGLRPQDDRGTGADADAAAAMPATPPVELLSLAAGGIGSPDAVPAPSTDAPAGVTAAATGTATISRPAVPPTVGAEAAAPAARSPDPGRSSATAGTAPPRAATADARPHATPSAGAGEAGVPPAGPEEARAPARDRLSGPAGPVAPDGAATSTNPAHAGPASHAAVRSAVRPRASAAPTAGDEAVPRDASTMLSTAPRPAADKTSAATVVVGAGTTVAAAAGTSGERPAPMAPQKADTAAARPQSPPSGSPPGPAAEAGGRANGFHLSAPADGDAASGQGTSPTAGDPSAVAARGQVGSAAAGDRTAPPPPAEQIAVQIHRGVQQGANRIQIHLVPAELGRIDVRLEFQSDGRVNAAVAVERPETLELLQRDVRGLERALQDAGLKTDGGSLTFNLRDEGRNPFGSGSPSAEDGTPLARPGATLVDSPAADGDAPWRRSDRAIDISV